MQNNNSTNVHFAPGYFHVYNSGNNHQEIFKDDEDYTTFLSMMVRHIMPTSKKDARGGSYAYIGDCISVNAYCLQPGVIHLLVFVKDTDVLTSLMRRVNTAYVRYFNQKYSRIGTPFSDIYKSRYVSDDAYLRHIIRYMHRTAQDYKEWKWSSFNVYTRKIETEWLDYKQLQPMDSSKYLEFMEDTVGANRAYNFIKSELANTSR